MVLASLVLRPGYQIFGHLESEIQLRIHTEQVALFAVLIEIAGAKHEDAGRLRAPGVILDAVFDDFVVELGH